MAHRQHGGHRRGGGAGGVRILRRAVHRAGEADRPSSGAGGAAGGAVPGTGGGVPYPGERGGVPGEGAGRRVPGGVCDGSEELRESAAVLSKRRVKLTGNTPQRCANISRIPVSVVDTGILFMVGLTGCHSKCCLDSI